MSVDATNMAVSSARATHEPSRKRLVFAVGIAIALAGCSREPEKLSWFNAPQDPQARMYAMRECLASAKGPERTNYNDWDEAIESCSGFASRVSIYCPTGISCSADVPSLQAVRRMVPTPATIQEQK